MSAAGSGGREELGSLEKEGQRSERHLDEALVPTALLAPAGLLVALTAAVTAQ